MSLLDLEWEKEEARRGCVLVRSGGEDYLVDLSEMVQSTTGASPQYLLRSNHKFKGLCDLNLTP